MIDGFTFGLGAAFGAIAGVAICVITLVAVNWVVEQFE